MPGPAPKSSDQTRRRNAPIANTVQLPAEGRVGDPPEWPYGSECPDVWAEFWATPQAAQWERQGMVRLVARYVMVLALVENPETISATLLGEVRQLEDRLGLSPMAMLRLRWEVVADEVAGRRDSKPVASKARRRLKVAGDAVERPRGAG